VAPERGGEDVLLRDARPLRLELEDHALEAPRELRRHPAEDRLQRLLGRVERSGAAALPPRRCSSASGSCCGGVLAGASGSSTILRRGRSAIATRPCEDAGSARCGELLGQATVGERAGAVRPHPGERTAVDERRVEVCPEGYLRRRERRIELCERVADRLVAGRGPQSRRAKRPRDGSPVQWTGWWFFGTDPKRSIALARGFPTATWESSSRARLLPSRWEVSSCRQSSGVQHAHSGVRRPSGRRASFSGEEATIRKHRRSHSGVPLARRSLDKAKTPGRCVTKITQRPGNTRAIVPNAAQRSRTQPNRRSDHAAKRSVGRRMIGGRMWSTPYKSTCLVR
jgi:hypothetical protein